MMTRIAPRALRACLGTALVSALCVPASAGQTDYYLKLGGVSGETDSGKGDQIEIHSIQWGSPAEAIGSATGGAGAGKAKFNEFTITKTTDKASPGGVSVAAGDVNGDGTAAPRKPTIGKATISPKSLPGSAGANETLTVGSSQTESGQATGKRQHMPLRISAYYDSPQGTGPGSLTVGGSFPGCTVGKRYAGAQFAASGKTYVLHDVEVVDCGGTAAGPEERITFVYGKVTVRGWDPEKKEK